MRDLLAVADGLEKLYQDALLQGQHDAKEQAADALKILATMGQDAANMVDRDVRDLTAALAAGKLTRKSFEVKLKWRALLLRARAGNVALVASVNAQVKLIEGARKFGEAAARLLLAVL